MTIHQITYRSDDCHVKGFLALPDDFDGVNLADLALTSQGRVPWSIDSSIDLGEMPVAITLSSKAKGPRRPALIYCRGGIGRVGMVRLNWVRLFAELGYIIFAPAYRGNLRGDGRDEFGGADREDVHAAYRLLESLPIVDPHRISLLGFSRGSINATLTAVEIPGIHRLVLWGGVSDLQKTYEERVDLRRMLKRVIGGSPNKVPHEYQRRSPIHMAHLIPCPTLIVHGTNDVQVDVDHGERMYERLRQMAKPVHIHRYIGYGHHLPTPVHEAVVERMFDWLC